MVKRKHVKNIINLIYDSVVVNEELDKYIAVQMNSKWAIYDVEENERKTKFKYDNCIVADTCIFALSLTGNGSPNSRFTVINKNGIGNAIYACISYTANKRMYIITYKDGLNKYTVVIDAFEGKIKLQEINDSGILAINNDTVIIRNQTQTVVCSDGSIKTSVEIMKTKCTEVVYINGALCYGKMTDGQYGRFRLNGDLINTITKESYQRIKQEAEDDLLKNKILRLG